MSAASLSALDTVRRLIGEQGAEAALVTHGPDIAWAVGFTGSNGVLVVTETTAVLITDGRYRTQAVEEVRGADIHITQDPLPTYVGSAGMLGTARRVAIQGDDLTVSALNRYRASCPDVAFLPVESFLAEARAAKTASEIAGVQRAQAATCAVFESIVPLIRPGLTERDLAAEIVVRLLRAGASAMSFDPIVASGARGALPHGRPSDKPFEAGDLVVIDIGGVFDGLCSDLTRTVAVGEPAPDTREAYEAVRRAHSQAIAQVRAGVTGRVLDEIARGVLDDAGLAEHFTHSLGHGVGREVHEWPRLSSQVEHVLPEGATVTIEPGVYLPGRFGIRIEDVVVVREGGAENLTPLSTELLVL